MLTLPRAHGARRGALRPRQVRVDDGGDTVSTHRPTKHEDAALDMAVIAIRIMEAVLKLVEEHPTLAGVFSDVLAAELAPHAFKLAWELFSTEAAQRRTRSDE